MLLHHATQVPWPLPSALSSPVLGSLWAVLHCAIIYPGSRQEVEAEGERGNVKPSATAAARAMGEGQPSGSLGAGN